MIEELDLSIVIVSWNCWDHLRKCLDSIYNTTYKISYEVIIIDNNSSDNTVDEIKKFFKNVNLIPLENNLGFPKANNIGFKLAKGRYILALNPDTELGTNAISTSFDYLENEKQYACVGVKTLKPDGDIQLHCARQFLTLNGAIWGIFLLDKIFKKVKLFHSPDMPFWDHNNDTDVDTIQGAYMFFRKSFYNKYGGFDETIPMFYEDLEYCLRINRAGFKIRYLSNVFITHHVGVSSKKSVPLWISELRYIAYYLFIKNYQGPLYSRLYLAFLLISIPLRIIEIPFLLVAFKIIKKKNGIKIYIIDLFASLSFSLKKILFLKIKYE